jgi:hypothetical protein
MSGDFYSTGAQLKREVRGRWRRLERGNLLRGTLLALGSFYAFRSVGQSQVYEVTVPFLTVAGHLSILVFTQVAPERNERTGAFFHNLPRDRRTTFLADAMYFLGHAIFYLLLIASGIYLKLGGADITPYYRIHPEIALLPVAVVFASLWYCSRYRSFRHIATSTTVLVTLIGLLLFRVVVMPEATLENGFLPPRDFPLALEWIAAVVPVALTAATAWRASGTLESSKRVQS